jgi:iron-sulfur cluster assembly protein
VSPADVDAAAARVEASHMDAAPVTLTPAARAKLAEFTAAEPGLGLRVYTTPGGCSGYRYAMMLEDAPRADDVCSDLAGIPLYLDPASAPLVAGSTIDYVDALMGAGFVVENPNATASCACGSSFRTADSAGAPGACGR